MNEYKYELAARILETHVDLLLDEVEAGKDMWNPEMSEDEYRTYVSGQWLSFQNLFKSYELGISECDYNRILAKLDKLYDYVHNRVEIPNRVKKWDPFDL